MSLYRFVTGVGTFALVLLSAHYLAQFVRRPSQERGSWFVVALGAMFGLAREAFALTGWARIAVGLGVSLAACYLAVALLVAYVTNPRRVIR